MITEREKIAEMKGQHKEGWIETESKVTGSHHVAWLPDCVDLKTIPIKQPECLNSGDTPKRRGIKRPEKAPFAWFVLNSPFFEKF